MQNRKNQFIIQTPRKLADITANNKHGHHWRCLPEMTLLFIVQM